MTALLRNSAPRGTHDTLNNLDTQGLATSGVIKAFPGTIFEIIGTNNSGSTRYFQLFDSATVPADTALPTVAPIAIPAGLSFSIKFGAGVVFTSGIAWCSSTTLATKTVTGVADVWITATFQ